MTEELSLLDPKMDYIFKSIFGGGENNPLLISFLNVLLKGKPHIKSVTPLPPELIKALKEDKASKLNVRAQSDNGTIFDIEIPINVLKMGFSIEQICEIADLTEEQVLELQKPQ